MKLTIEIPPKIVSKIKTRAGKKATIEATVQRDVIDLYAQL